MNRFTRHVSLCVILLASFIGLAQSSEKPKVALVLSGGGAKGIAHIPLLQMLDSLNIVPDLVVGTSMGSVIGGFYAMGYSGDSIANIAKTADWSRLLGGKTALKDVSIEEKSEFGRYLIDLDISESTLKMRAALLNDQFLREFFSAYTFPVYNTSNFDELPIPFRAVATDIVNGSEVVIRSGSLATAMRASMSIPSIFKPVPYNNVLLVDGGILNNFPIDIAKSWGADIIIGSDVGGGMLPKEELEGMSSVLFQSAMLVSNKKNPESRALCDILVDHVPHLRYGTGDFNKANALYDDGKIAAQSKQVALIELSKKLSTFKQVKVILPSPPETIALDTIIYKGITPYNLDVVKARADISIDTPYTIHDIIGGLDRIMGTTLFNQVSSRAFVEGTSFGLEIAGLENSKHQLKTGLHFDSDRGIGLLANYTGRNVLGKSSRLLFTGDISSEPAFRVQYQKQFGHDKSWWWRSEVFGQFLDLNIYYQGNLYPGDISYNQLKITNQFNKNINDLSSYFGFGLSYNHGGLRPNITPDIDENFLLLKDYALDYMDIDIHYIYNSLSTVFFPKQGSLFKAKLSRSLFNSLDYESTNSGVLRIEDGKINDFTRLMLSYEKRLAVDPKLSLVFKTRGYFTFRDPQGSNEYAFDIYGTTAQYNVGGNLGRVADNSLQFPGLRENEIIVNQIMDIGFELQISALESFFIQPHVNYATVGYKSFKTYMDDAFFPKSKWSDQELMPSYLLSCGATLSYNSFLGPISLDWTFINGTNKGRIFLGVGLFLNDSD